MGRMDRLAAHARGDLVARAEAPREREQQQDLPGTLRA
jgi:hypothetical protein